MVDDFIPCFPNAGPIFSHNSDLSVLWLALLQKAYAKLHGGYEKLINGSACDLLLDLTGFPTLSLTLRDEAVFDMIQSGQLWHMIKLYLSQGYIIAASYNSEIESQHDQLVPPHRAFSILDIDESNVDNHSKRLLQMRNPYG